MPRLLLDERRLAEQVKQLAEESLLALRRDELHGLAEDLEKGDALDRWAEIDLLASFARPESLARPRPAPRPPATGRVASVVERLRLRSPGESLLEAALGVLVFVPLLVTWIGLLEAIRAYGRLSRDDPQQATRPFLQLWQSGFGGHLPSLGRFENVALTAVLVISLLVAIAIVHARTRTRAEQEEARSRAEKERVLAGLTSTLTRVQLALVRHRSASPDRFVSELNNAAMLLKKVMAEQKKGQQSVIRAADSAKEATGRLEEASKRLAQEVPRLAAAADRIEAAARAGEAAAGRAGADTAAASRDVADRLKEASVLVRTELAKLTDTQTRRLKETGDLIRTELGRLTDTQAQRLTEAGDLIRTELGKLTDAQQALTRRSESVAQAVDRASEALVTSSGRTDDAVSGMARATERWDAAAAHWQDAAARLDSRLGALVGEPPGNGARSHPPLEDERHREPPEGVIK